MLKVGVALSIICGFEWLFDGSFLLEAYTILLSYGHF